MCEFGDALHVLNKQEQFINPFLLPRLLGRYLLQTYAKPQRKRIRKIHYWSLAQQYVGRLHNRPAVFPLQRHMLFGPILCDLSAGCD